MWKVSLFDIPTLHEVTKGEIIFHLKQWFFKFKKHESNKGEVCGGQLHGEWKEVDNKKGENDGGKGRGRVRWCKSGEGHKNQIKVEICEG